MTATKPGFHPEMGKAVERRRKDLRLSMRGAADRAGISDDTWRRVEREDASVRDRMLDLIAAALEMDPAELYRLAGRAYSPVARISDPRIDALADQMAQMSEALGSMAETLRRHGQGR